MTQSALGGKRETIIIPHYSNLQLRFSRIALVSLMRTTSAKATRLSEDDNVAKLKNLNLNVSHYV